MASMDIAENTLRSLEERVLAVEASAKCNATSGVSDEDKVSIAIKAYQIQMLNRLKEIQAAMEREQSGSSASGDVLKIIAERDMALAEVKKQNTEIAKLNYRVNHLVKALNEEERKNQGSC